MDLKRWLSGDARERFWIEFMVRPDVGAELNAPETKDNEAPFWGYSIVCEPEDGDIVFHYSNAKPRGIIGRSIIDGGWWEDNVVWGARGRAARDAGVEPYPRPGWRRGLRGFTPLDGPMLSRIRELESDVVALRGALERQHRQVYFPFVIQAGRLRGAQAYLTKLPTGFVELFPELGEVVGGLSRPRRVRPVAYRSADESIAVSERDPSSPDPALVERGLRSHAATQNALAEQLRARGIEPKSPTADEPNYDIAWEEDGVLYVCEVKSLTDANEERQLRIGLGQVLRYRQQMERLHGRDVRAVLMLEREPTDSSWRDLAAELAVQVHVRR